MNTEKKITDEDIKKIFSILLQTFDSLIEKIPALDICSPEWQTFKKNDMELLIDRYCFARIGDTLSIGLLDYATGGKYIGVGPKINDNYALQIRIPYDKGFIETCLQKAKTIRELIYQHQRKEVEQKFIQAISSFDASVATSVSNLPSLPKDFPVKEWMMKLYKASWNHFFAVPIEEIPFDLCKPIFHTYPQIPCVVGDQYLRVVYDSNFKNLYELRFGELSMGKDYISIFESEELKKYTQLSVDSLLFRFEEDAQNRLLTYLTS